MTFNEYQGLVSVSFSGMIFAWIRMLTHSFIPSFIHWNAFCRCFCFCFCFWPYHFTAAHRVRSLHRTASFLLWYTRAYIVIVLYYYYYYTTHYIQYRKMEIVYGSRAHLNILEWSTEKIRLNFGTSATFSFFLIANGLMMKFQFKYLAVSL